VAVIERDPIVIQGEAERLATLLEAANNGRRSDYRYAFVEREVLEQAVKFLREVQGGYADLKH